MSKVVKIRNKHLLIVAIVIIEMLSGAEINIFTPSFPELIRTFSLSPFAVELTIAVNMLGAFFSVLIVGSLSDDYSKKAVLFHSIFVFILGSIICSFSTTFEGMLIGRFMQGLGVGGPLVVPYGIISDSYPKSQQYSKIGIINGSLTLFIAIAPVIGSYLTMHWGWRSNFIALLLLSLIALFLCIFYIPEYETPQVKKTQNLLHEYKIALSSPSCIYYIAVISFLTAPYWIFTSIAPILYVTDIGVPLGEYGFHQGSIALVFSCLSFMSGTLIQKFGQKKCFMASMMLLLAFMLIVLLMILDKNHNPFLITSIGQILSLGVTLPLTILYPNILSKFPHAKGKTTALVISSRQIFLAIGIQITSYFHDGTFAPVGFAMFLSLILMMYFCYRLLKADQVFENQITAVNAIENHDK